MKIRKRWVATRVGKKTTRDHHRRPPSGRGLMNRSEVRLVVAATVALMAGIFIHPHLAVALAPICCALYTLSIVRFHRPNNEGVIRHPLIYVPGHGANLRKRD
jgi:hypothetical protein